MHVLGTLTGVAFVHPVAVNEYCSQGPIDLASVCHRRLRTIGTSIPPPSTAVTNVPSWVLRAKFACDDCPDERKGFPALRDRPVRFAMPYCLRQGRRRLTAVTKFPLNVFIVLVDLDQFLT